MCVAIIPARGGSRRIPGKNIRDFCGKPIISYSIRAALESGIFSEVMVSTDCEEIAGIAREYGACVPFMRSEETSDDHATTASVLLEVVGEYKKRSREFDSICCLYPTAPFVTAEKLKKAYDTFLQSGADSLMPVVAFSYPPLRGLVITDGKLGMKWPEYMDTRSQDLELIYHDCGQFYFMHTETLLRDGSMIYENTVPVLVPEIETQDVDNEDDWKLAEMKYRFVTDINYVNKEQRCMKQNT